MYRLPILALPCLLASAAPKARANEWLRATTAIDNQSKRTWILEGRALADHLAEVVAPVVLHVQVGVLGLQPLLQPFHLRQGVGQD